MKGKETQIEEGLDHKGEFCGACFRDNEGKAKEPELIHKRMNDINTFQCAEGDIFLRGTDEYGDCLQLSFCAYDFINWISTEEIDYIKEQIIKHIKKI
tara:strand:+ start:163 stop:456 length:294 start_codon:yes stop_codon:yes gene_type:complete